MGLPLALLIRKPRGAVAIPDSAFNWLPFSIFSNGDGTFNTGGFDLETYANITGDTYYVDISASGANNGTSWADAYTDFTSALNNASAAIIQVAAGVYPWGSGWENVSPARNIKVVGNGTVIMNCAATGLSWVASDSHYVASYATGIGSVWDQSSPDVNGDYIPLKYVANEAAVDAEAGTWYYDAVADEIYVRTSDSREPDADIICSVGSTQFSMNDAVTYYIENIKFYGGGRPGFVTEPGAANLYAKDCEFKYSGSTSGTEGLLVAGGGEIILQNCVAAKNSQDGFKYQLSTVDCNMVEIDCIGRSNGLVGDTNANGSSRHNGGANVRINGTYTANYGPCIADINTTKTWMLGCTMSSPVSASSRFGVIANHTAEIWLDTCTTASCTDGELYANVVGSVIRYRNHTPASPTTGGGGTVTTY